MEGINGNTMLNNIKRNPIGVFKKIEKLASLQMEVSDNADGLDSRWRDGQQRILRDSSAHSSLLHK